MPSLRGLVRVLVLGRRDGLRSRLRRRLGLCGEVPSAPSAPVRSAEPVTVPAQDSSNAVFRPVIRRQAVPVGTVAEVLLDGVALAVCNVDGTFFATSNTCPHAGGPIGDGALAGHSVTCPYHGWSFDVRDGRCAVSPEIILPTYETRVIGDDVCVRLPVSA